uniref:Uncharacterized protein n=1 Tax=Oryza sativa subsp. japonica TaxID=39947 RepID=Q339R9_ORYSJ|nr:hypothetical protein LOC_Os10g19090 [Oryza sativa Japonica Group]
MSRIRLMHEWAKNSELTRQIRPKFTSLRRGAIEEATCRIWARLAKPMVRPIPPWLRSMQGLDGRRGSLPNDVRRAMPTIPTTTTVIGSLFKELVFSLSPYTSSKVLSYSLKLSLLFSS